MTLSDPFFDAQESARIRAMVDYLRQMMENAAEQRPGSRPLFYWLKTTFARPAFADVVFGCRNKVYAVIASTVIEKPLQGGGIELAVTVEAERRDLVIRESIRNGIVPAMFPMWPDTLRPLHGDWNLLALPEGGLFDPVQAAGDDPVPMSDWELNNVAVRAAVARLREKGVRVTSSQDITGFYPQIWFDDSAGDKAWIVVFPDTTADGKAPMPAVARDLAAKLASSTGYVARVGVRSVEKGREIPCRGDVLSITFDGLQRI